MTEKELLKLKKSEVLEIMLAQSKEIDSLREQLAQVNARLEQRKIVIKESGSIAEASLNLTKIFEEAQKAADLYVYNVKRRADAKYREQAKREQAKADQAKADQPNEDSAAAAAGSDKQAD